MNAKEAADGFDVVYSGRLDQLGSANLASERMGRERNYLNGQLNDHGIRVRDALSGLEVLGDPMPEETFYTAFQKLDKDPAVYLEAAREPQPMAPDLFVREIAPRLAALVAAGASPGGEWQSRARKIEKLDKLRRRNRQLARERLHQMIYGMVERMENKDERPRKALGELSSALGILAALKRCAGCRADALDLLLAARPLSLQAKDSEIAADWFMRAAMLLVDLNRDVRAHHFLLEAGSLYFLAGSTAKQAEVVVARAYVLTHANHHSESRHLLGLVLPLLGEHQGETRLVAHQTLAKNLRECGEVVEACKHLSIAIEMAGDDPWSLASCLWSKGKLLARLGDTSAALISFEEALPLVAKVTGAGELAELGMEYAKLLWTEGRWPELRALAADLATWIQPLRGTKKLQDIIEDFTALILVNDLTEESFCEILRRIQAFKAASAPYTEIPSP